MASMTQASPLPMNVKRRSSTRTLLRRTAAGACLDAIATLDQRIEEVISGQIVIPSEPPGRVLVLDDAGNEIDRLMDAGN